MAEPMRPSDVSVTPVSPAHSRLEYDRSTGGVSRRQMSFFLLLLTVNTLLFAAFICLPAGMPILKDWWADRQAKRATEKQRQAEEESALAQAAARQAAYDACARYVAPADQIVYAESPADTRALLAADGRARTADDPLPDSIDGSGAGGIFGGGGGGGAAGLMGGGASGPPSRVDLPNRRLLNAAGFRPPVARGLPDVLAAIRAQIPHGAQPESCVFLHEMSRAGGARRLVCVSVVPAVTSGDPADGSEPSEILVGRALIARVMGASLSPLETTLRIDATSVPRGTFTRSVDKPPTIVQRGHWRIYAGQPDPEDSSHLTIAYEIDGKPGVIDGWLRDGDRLMLEPRAGRLVGWEDSRSYSWDLGDGPATAAPGPRTAE